MVKVTLEKMLRLSQKYFEVDGRDENYEWPGTMRKNSIFWWHYTQAPTAIDFMQDGQFPPQFNDDLFVALFGASYAKGTGEKGKR